MCKHLKPFVRSECSKRAVEDPTIFGLTIDCYDEIFDYLSLNELYSIGQTCRLMRKVAGEYFQRNFVTFEKICCYDGVYTVCSSQGNSHQRVYISKLSPYITRISHYYNIFGPHYYIYKHSDEFIAVNRIDFIGVSFNRDRVKYIQPILERAEVLQLTKCKFYDGNFHESFLQFCTNLKQLCVHDDIGHVISDGESWLEKRFGNINHLELKPRWPCKIGKLNEFLQQNRDNLRSFSTCSRFLWFNQHQLSESDVKLDELEITVNEMDHIKISVEGVYMHSICEVLNGLYARGFYKRLRLSLIELDQNCSELLTTLGGLDKLHLKHFSGIFRVSQLVNLKELKISNGIKAKDMDILAKNLINLTEVSLGNTTYNDFLPFVRHSANLQVLQLYPKNKKQFNGGALNLNALNDERAHLIGARKLTIHVPDEIFLATKWTTKYGITNFNFIEMKRDNSYNYDEEYKILHVKSE